MRLVESPEVFLVQQPSLDWDEIRRYLRKVGERTNGVDSPEVWADRVQESMAADGDAIVEFGGRLCYRSWVAGANVNVVKVREDSKDYLANVLRSGHGSVTEHANYSFIMDDVSRVFTHELVRHRAGVAVSQESMRFVRLDDIPFWMPPWARSDEELTRRSMKLLEAMEEHQLWMADRFGLDDVEPCPVCDGSGEVPTGSDDDGPLTFGDEPCPACDGKGQVIKNFAEKKHKTSFMRRFAPDGVATGMLVTINIRALRHIIYMRTALGAEEEIRIVFDDVARIMQQASPNLMQDYSPNEDLEWIPAWLKV